jgi:hypothetical protein
MKNGLRLSILSLFLTLVFVDNSSACNWNCDSADADGGTYTKGNNFGLKAPSHSGFEKHAFYNMPKKKHSYEYIKEKSKARAGSLYQRFELRAGDCFPSPKGGWNDCKTDRERFELSSKPRQKPEGKQCYGYSLMLDENFQSVHPTNTDLGQVHQTGGPTGNAGGFKSFPPLIQIGAKYDKLIFGWHELTGDENNITDNKRQFELAKISDMKGVWTDISFCLDFQNKRMDAWVNGEKKVEILRSPINFNPDKIYFKYGIYRSFVSRYKNIHGAIPTQIAYYDEVRRGNSIEKVDRNINPDLKAVD